MLQMFHLLRLLSILGCPDCSLVSGLQLLQAYDRETLLAHQLRFKIYGYCQIQQRSNSKDYGLWRLSDWKHYNLSGLLCGRGKSKKHSHKPKAEDFIQENLYLLHMDLYGPIRIQSINGKKYILVIVDNYSRFTWVKFLRSKDEVPEFVIKFLKMIQVRLNATVRNIRTDNGTEFVNQTLRGPGPQLMTPATLSSGLVPNPPSPTPYVPLTKKDWEILFQPMFDEYFSPLTSVASSVLAAVAPVPADSTSIPSLTSVDQDAPSLSTLQTSKETQALVLSSDVEE
ncbi:retrovirus-related pol polyprotein from transposon TNT 1-94 [Tanacetum coccineum]